MDGLFPEPGQGGSAVAGEYAGGSEAQPSVSRAFASMDPRWEPKGPFSRVATPFTAASTASRRCRSCIWGSSMTCLHCFSFRNVWVFYCFCCSYRSKHSLDTL